MEKQIEAAISQGEYAKAASLAESVLKNLPTSAFHKIIGRDLLHLTKDAADHISFFYSEAQREFAVKAMYFEMNSFTVNPDMWFFDSFAFSFCGNPDDPADPDWLADYEFSSHEAESDSFQITGYEDMQEVCAHYLNNLRDYDRDAVEAFEEIVTIRFIELFAHIVRFAKDHDLEWKDIPVFATSHDTSPVLSYRPG